MLSSDWLRARVSRLHRETESTITVYFTLERGRRLSYLAGQYVLLRMRFGQADFVRAYSLSSAPHENELAFTVKELFAGRISHYINESLEVGDEFWVSPALGDFHAEQEPATRPLLLVAGGAGITPVMSMIKDSLHRYPDRQLMLLYYNRSDSDVIFHDQLQELSGQHPSLLVTLLFTGEESLASGLVEKVSVERVTGAAAAMDKPSIWICGSASMVESLRSGLLGVGVAEGDVHAESFAMSSRPSANRSQHVQLMTWSSRFWGVPRRKSIPVMPGHTLLEASLKAGLRLPNRCREGHCGVCKQHVVSGRVEMDEPNCLTPEEARSGVVLTCIAWPQGAVTLESAKNKR